MAFHDPDRYIVRNHTSSYSILDTLFKGKPSTETFHGPRGQAFRLPQGLPVTVTDPYHLQVGSHLIRTDIYTLPSAPLMAVVDASPAYRQYCDLDSLLQSLQDPETDVSQFRNKLGQVVARGLDSGQPAQLVHPRSGFTAIWRPSQTRLVRTAEGHWFTVFAFELRPTNDLQSSAKRTTFGLDLGSAPVVCAAGGDGRVLGFGGQRLPLLDALRRGGAAFSAADQRILRTLTHAVGRSEAEEAIRYLARQGNAVYGEHLNLHGMWGGFIANGRLQATLDLHFSWLPQGLYRAGVPFKRVNARWSSQLCHIHPQTIGKRRGKVFSCPDCNSQQHADINAARNIHDRGIQMYGEGRKPLPLPLRRAS